MRRDDGSRTRVGLLVLFALLVAAVGIFLVGEKNFLFSRNNRYYIEFRNVQGLATGNPVQLNGVNVGQVAEIVLPDDAGESELRVWVTVERRYDERVRGDSMARIKTLGLLGDKYVEITSGSPEFPAIASGHKIPAAPATDVDQLISSGEDVVENILRVSYSLANILERIDSGEGILGALIAETGPGEESGRDVRQTLVSTLESVEGTAEAFETGRGPLPRLLHDEALANRVEAVVARLEGVLDAVENGDGLLPALLDDSGTRERFNAVLGELEATARNLNQLTADFQGGDGLLFRLLHDEEYGERVTGEVEELLRRLNDIAAKLEGGDGTAAQLINDPAIAQGIEDILVGIHESKFLRWLIRNRQKKGIEKRYEETQRGTETEEGEAGEAPAAAPPSLGGSPSF